METDPITIHLHYITPFVKKDEAVRTVMRYLHDRGIEGEIGKDDDGVFVRYHPPAEDFREFSENFYSFITAGGKSQSDI